MSDLIDRQQAIDAVKNYWKQQVDNLGKDKTFEEVTGMCDFFLTHNAGILEAIDRLPSAQPTIEPECKKDVIQKFHDYQIEWLTSHCDLELEPVLESWIVRFLHDTANCYMMEVEHE